jgi:hypothetical protein
MSRLNAETVWPSFAMARDALDDLYGTKTKAKSKKKVG